MNEENIEIVNPTDEESRDFAAAQRETQLKFNRRSVLDTARRMVWVTFAFEGIHKYPAAADTAGEGDMDVSFLQYPHRHMFHFKVWIEIFHNDREIEFIQFKRFCEKQFRINDDTDAIQLNNNSVEMLADQLYMKIATTFPKRDIWIEVSEDEENGTLIKYNQ